MPALWPTGSTNQPRLSDLYGPRPPIQGSRPFHFGVDVPMGLSAPVYAAQDGIVVFSGSNGSLGQQVVIDTGTFQFLYPHMEEGSLVREGTLVSQRQQLCRVGLTGNTTGPHVCFRVFQGPWWDDDKARDPLDVMAALNAATAGMKPTPLPPPRKRREQNRMFSIIRRKSDGTIAVIDSSKSTYRLLSLGEWLGLAADGRKYADLTDERFNAAIKTLTLVN